MKLNLLIKIITENINFGGSNMTLIFELCLKSLTFLLSKLNVYGEMT